MIPGFDGDMPPTEHTGGEKNQKVMAARLAPMYFRQLEPERAQL